MNGTTDSWALALAILVWIAYAIYVTRQIRESGQYEDAQLKLQTVLAFAIPFLGALFVHFMFFATRAKEPARDRHHVREEHPIDGNLQGRGKDLSDE